MNTIDWLPPDVRSAAVKRSLKSGDMLFRAGGRVTGLCEVVSGVVRLVRTDRAGREIVLHKATAGEDSCRSLAVFLERTIKDLAGELGLTHEALYRTLADMQAKGEIERLPGTIKLLTGV